MHIFNPNTDSLSTLIDRRDPDGFYVPYNISYVDRLGNKRHWAEIIRAITDMLIIRPRGVCWTMNNCSTGTTIYVFLLNDITP